MEIKTEAKVEAKTVQQAIDAYLSSGNRRTAPTVSECKRLSSQFGQVPLTDLSPFEVTRYREERLSSGAAVSTVIRELSILKTILNVTVNELGWLPSSPISGVAYPKNPVKRNRYITPSEEDRLLSTCPSWLHPIVTLALDTGMRRGEILNLDWSSVSFTHKMIVVEKSKNNTKRGIPMTTRTYTTLEGLNIITQSPKEHLGVVFLFNSIPVSTSALEYAFRKSVDGAGINDLHFHDLRHTFCSRLVQSGVDLYTVQTLAGHKSIAMTQRYAHLNVDNLRGAIMCLNQQKTP